MPNFRSSLPLPSSHTECETWAAYDAAFTTLFRWCRLIATKTAWHSFNHVTWLASWAPIVRWIFQFSREHWATSPGSNGPREIHPRDWSYGFTGGTLCQNTSEATGVERVSCVGEWGQPDSRLHSWTFCALWLIFHPMMCVLTCPRKYANGCAIWCRATVIAVFLSFSWMAMHTLAWTRSLAFGMPMLPPSQLLLAWQTQRWRTPTARSCANSPSVTTCVSVTRSFAVAPRSILMMGFALLGLIISYSPKAFVAKSSPVKYGIVLEMRYRSSTVMPGEITDRWSLASTSSFATAKRSTREWHGTRTNCTAAYGALASQHSCMMWSPNCEVSNGMLWRREAPTKCTEHYMTPSWSKQYGILPGVLEGLTGKATTQNLQLQHSDDTQQGSPCDSFVTTLRTSQKSAMPLRNANPLQKQSAKSSAASGMISKPILWLKSPKLGGDETLLQPGSFHELWVGREWARRGGKWPLLPRLSLTKRVAAVPVAKWPARRSVGQRVSKPNSRSHGSAPHAHLREGRISAWRTQRELRHARLRRTPPQWSFPAVVWRMLLEPGRGMRCARLGVGAEKPAISNTNVSKGFLMLHASMQASWQSPACWHRSSAFTVAKKSAKPGPSGLRLLHTLESLGKAYYAQVWKRVPKTYLRHYATGYMASRRREQAILQQSLLRHRLRQGRVSHFTAFYDLANAFASASHQRALEPFIHDAALPPAECAHLRQRLYLAQMQLPCADGVLQCRIGSGTLPGDTIAGPWFLAAYHPCLDAYLQTSPQLAITAVFPDELQRGLELMLPGRHVPAQLDVSLSSYADDVARTMRAASAISLQRTASLSSTAMSRSGPGLFAERG